MVNLDGGTFEKRAREKAKRKRKAERIGKRLTRKRKKLKEKIATERPEMHIAEINCVTKSSFPNKATAFMNKPRGLNIYECNICARWHLTSRDV